MFRRSFFTGAMGVLFALAAFFAAPLTSTANAQTSDLGERSKVFVQALADDAVRTLTETEISPTEREQRFRKLLVDTFDVAAIGRWVMGRYWRRASKAEKAEYQALFEDFIVVTYAKRFGDYTGERLMVVHAITQNGTDAIVFSELKRATNQPPIRVDWRLRANNKTLKVVDLVIEGVSMSQTQRSEFGSVVKRNGGKIAGLISALREKTAQLTSDTSTEK